LIIAVIVAAMGSALILGNGGTVLQPARIIAAIWRAVALAAIATLANIEDVLTPVGSAMALA
jgi:hypothetical protein